MARFHWTIRKLWPASRAKKIAVLLVFILLACSGGFVAVSEQTSFCNSCHIMNPYYASWRQSSHSEVNCLECHVQPGFSGIVRAKLNGLAQAVDCFLDRTSPKPNALVEDASCLRDGCHVKDSLSSEPLTDTDRKYKFSHQAHVDTELFGIRVLCSTCHSHFEGREHFKVSTQTCFICHLWKAGTSVAGLMQTKCLDCHDEQGFKTPWVKNHHREESAFALQGKHASLQCRQCHNQQLKAQELVRTEMVEIKRHCQSCHQDPHQNQMGASCQSCHSESGWMGSNLLFSHDQQASFKLEGPHATLACDACHSQKEKRYRPIAHECADCHQKQALAMQGTAGALRGAADFHYGRLSCTDCHNVQDARQSISQFRQRCASCHNSHYGELLYAWANSFDKNRLRAEQALKEIQNPTDERRIQLERMIAEAREIGFHNIRLVQQAWKATRNVPRGW